ncbi:MAG TPA: hypothetical protein VLA29_05310 [Acidimicrobiia bacterium]|nr:hypothetical protein [Acidimicrobiia bacterium]
MLDPRIAEIHIAMAGAVEHFGRVPTNDDLRTYSVSDGEATRSLHYLGTPDGVAAGLLEVADELQLSDRVVEICEEHLGRT